MLNNKDIQKADQAYSNSEDPEMERIVRSRIAQTSEHNRWAMLYAGGIALAAGVLTYALCRHSGGTVFGSLYPASIATVLCLGMGWWHCRI